MCAGCWVAVLGFYRRPGAANALPASIRHDFLCREPVASHEFTDLSNRGIEFCRSRLLDAFFEFGPLLQ